MKNNKKKILFIILVCLLVIGGVLFLILKPKAKKDEEPKVNNTTPVEEFKGFNFKDVTELEYGFGLEALVEEVICSDKCLYQGEELSYTITEVKELGKQQVEVKINYQDKSYEHTFEVNVIDTEKPVLKLSKNEDSITVGDTFEASKYIETVSDNFDKLEVKDVQIEGEVDTKKAGEYKVTYKLRDSSGNEVNEELTIQVKEKETTVTKPSNQTTSNNSKPSTNTGSTSKPTKPSNQTTTKPNTSTTTKPSTSTSTNTGSTLKNDINSVKLNPLKTRFPDVDNKVEKIISSVTKSGMSNYDKLVAIYDYVKSKYTYKMSIVFDTELTEMMNEYHYYYYDALQIYNANYILNAGSGVCDNFSALFMIMARRLGFDAYVVGGEAPSGNSRGGHAWVLIRANGKNYFFDPQIENHVKGKYGYFGKTEAEKKGFYTDYNLQTSMTKFHKFQAKSVLSATYTVSGAASATATLKSDSARTERKSVSIKLGEAINIKISFSGDTKYHYVVNTFNKNLKSGESSGEDINFEYKPTSEETTVLYVSVRTANGNMVEYILQVNVTDQSKIKMFGSYSSLPYPSGIVRFEFSPYGGYAPYTYKIDILETDATEGYETDDSNSEYQYLTPGNGTYFKLKVTVKDSKGTSYSETFNYDVKKNYLKSLK